MRKKVFSPLINLVLLLIFSFNFPVNAESFFAALSGHWYAGAQLGTMNIKARGRDDLQIAPSGISADTFNVTGAQNGMQYGIFGGYAVDRLNAKWFPQYRFGMNLWQTSTMTIKGLHSFDYLDNNYNYQYSLNIAALGLTFAVDLFNWHHWAPFVGGAVNLAAVKLSHFAEAPADASTTPESLTFSDQITAIDVLYEGDAGLRYGWNNWQFQLAYQYLPVGHVKTGAGTTNVTSVLPQTVNIIANNVLLSISRQF
jgi:hypothetical protein